MHRLSRVAGRAVCSALARVKAIDGEFFAVGWGSRTYRLERAGAVAFDDSRGSLSLHASPARSDEKVKHPMKETRPSPE